MAVHRNALASFGTPLVDVTAITHYSLWIDGVFWLSEANSGTGDQTPEVGEEMTIPANMAVLTFPRGVFQSAGDVDYHQAAIGAVTITAGAHTGPPGSNGTSNEVTGAWYSRPTLTLTTAAS